MADENRKSYLQERVYDQMGLTEEDCSLLLYHRPGQKPNDSLSFQTEPFVNKNGIQEERIVRGKDGNPIPAPVPFLHSDRDDNIEITVYKLNRTIVSYEPDKVPKYADPENCDVTYKVIRYCPEFLRKWEENHPGQEAHKYKFPGGETKKGTYPFFPPSLVDKFDRGEHIETLVLTEGYFKSMKACKMGIDCVGLGSITLYADQKTKQLYQDIVSLINKCTPNNLVILYDGDCTDLGKSAVKEMERGNVVDLSKRPATFKSSMLKLRELLLEFKNEKGQPCEIFFAYVNKMRPNDPPKGLDDLLCDEEFAPEAEAIVDDLNNPGRPGVYFTKFNLRTMQNKAAAMFHLQSPEKFYDEWKEVIGTKKFKFQGYTYEWLKSENKLDQVLDNRLDDYIAVGNQLYFVMNEEIPGTKGGFTVKFLERDKSVMNARFGKGTADKLFQHKYFENFTIVPDNDENSYSREIRTRDGYRLYNMYYPPTVKQEVGKWPTIEKLLRHVTAKYCSDTDHSSYEMLLDYFSIAMCAPMQFLPIIILVSKERGTGKSSLLTLIDYMFGKNAVIGGNDLIASKFNTSIRGKLFVCVDESCLGENREVGEALKYMSTTRSIQIEGKGKDKEEYINFAKFVLCSNEVKKAVFVSKDEIRYWVLNVLPWTEEERDVDAAEKMEEEVKYFMHFLYERYHCGTMFVKEKEHRMWFHPDRLMNEDLKILMSGSESNFESSFIEWLRNMFMDCHREHLDFDVAYIKKNVPDAQKKDESYIRDKVKEMPGVDVQKSSKYKMPFRVTEDLQKDAEMRGTPLTEDVGEIIWPHRAIQCRPYRFYAKNYLTPDEYLEYVANGGKKSVDPATNEQKQEEGTAVAAQTTLPLTPGVNADGKWPTLDANGNPISGADESAADGNSLGDDKGQPF